MRINGRVSVGLEMCRGGGAGQNIIGERGVFVGDGDVLVCVRGGIC